MTDGTQFTIEQRLLLLEQGNKHRKEALTQRLANDLKSESETMAILSLLKEVAQRLGCSEDDFLRCYQERVDYWHQKALERTEQIAPDLAVELDQRRPEADASGEAYAPLFPDESKEG